MKFLDQAKIYVRSGDGGNGVVALHGRGSLTARVGTAASHCCIRLNDRDVAWLAKHVPNGTRIDIQR